MSCLFTSPTGKKATFIHTPKTGGMWTRMIIRKVCKESGTSFEELQPAHKHAHPSITIQGAPKIRLEETSPFMFTFVRNPDVWYLSAYLYSKHRGGQASWDWMVKKAKSSNSLEEFVAAMPDGFLSDLYTAFTYGCEFVGATERLREDLLEVMVHLGFDPNVVASFLPSPAINTTDDCPKVQPVSVLSKEKEAFEIWLKSNQR